MLVEILTVGDELLTGAVIDTNSAYIAKTCEMFGLEVLRHTSVGDNLDQLVTVLKEISKRTDIVIISGGLGPTLDDLSREAAAIASDNVLELSSEALSTIESFFSNLGIPMPESNKKQCFFPKTSIPIENPIGSAPGFSLQINKALFFFLPGVPSEMKLMLNEQVIPFILQKFHNQLEMLNVKTLSTFGLAEASIGKQLESIEKNFPQVKFGTRATMPGIEVKLYARGKNGEDHLNQAQKAVTDLMGNWIYAEDEQSMEMIVGNLLRSQKSSVAIVERERGGIITDWLSSLSDSSSFLAFASVMNMERIKPILGNIPLLSNLELTLELAEKIHKLGGSTYSIAINGITTEEESERLGDQIGTVHIAIVDKFSSGCYSYSFSYGDKELKKKFFAMLALDLLRRKILKQKSLPEILGKMISHCS